MADAWALKGGAMERICLLPNLALCLAAALASAKPMAAAEPLACPPGTTLARDKPPNMSLACKNAAGKRHGPFLGRFRDSATRFRGQYQNGRRTGWWREWSAEGIQLREDEYEDGIPIARRRIGPEAGKERRSRPSDSVHPCPDDAVVAGAAPPEGNRQSCERRREDGAYVLHGTSIRWSGDRKKSETPYTDGTQHGVASEWSDDGTKVRETEYHHGRARRITRWDPLGQLESETLNDEHEKAARKTTWYPGGQMKSEEVAKPGGNHWDHREWHPNGQLEQKGQNRDRKRIGRWRWWNAEGKLTTVEAADALGGRSRKNFPVYEDDAPDWVPRPLPRPEARASSEPLRCPAGSRKTREIVRLTAENLGVAEEPLEEYSGWKPLLRIAELLQPLGWRNVCVVGGKRHGPAVEWSWSGERTREGEFRADRRHGTWIEWNEQGQQQGVRAYLEGVPHGRWLRWHANGGFRSIEHHERGVPDGVSAFWNPNGTRSLVSSHRLGTEHGGWIWYKESGLKVKQGEYQDGEQHGLWIEWGKDGYKRSENSYENGRAEGPFAKWYAKGVPANQGELRNGERHGLWIDFYEGRKRSEIHYVDGKREGRFTNYHKNGRIRKHGSYERNRRVGTWTEYYSDGALSNRGDYAWCENPPKVPILKGHNARTVDPGGCRMGPWISRAKSGDVVQARDYDEIHHPDPDSGSGGMKVGVVRR
jgi:antitoxin component YwqK of YwqJK toxin-antitoxin module